MHGIELSLKGRDRFLKGRACWEAPKLRGSLVLLSLIPCPSLCCFSCSGSIVGRSRPFIYSDLFMYCSLNR